MNSGVSPGRDRFYLLAWQAGARFRASLRSFWMARIIRPVHARLGPTTFERFYSGRPLWIVYGAMRDKAVAEMAALLFPLAERVILTAPANSRAIAPEHIPAQNAAITHTVAEAVALVRKAPPRTVVFITGSLFVVGEARALLVQ